MRLSFCKDPVQVKSGSIKRLGAGAYNYETKNIVIKIGLNPIRMIYSLCHELTHYLMDIYRPITGKDESLYKHYYLDLYILMLFNKKNRQKEIDRMFYFYFPLKLFFHQLSLEIDPPTPIEKTPFDLEIDRLIEKSSIPGEYDDFIILE